MTTKRRGRPSRGSDTASTRVSFRVTASEHMDLQRMALENRTRVSGLLRDAVNEFMSDYKDARVFRPTKNT